MGLRYLFGPVTADFAERHLAGLIHDGTVLPFNHRGDVAVTIGANDDWQDVLRRLPAGWRPDAVVLVLSKTSIPKGLWSAPAPIVALAENWESAFHYYRLRLPCCDVVAVEERGVDVFRRAGIEHVRLFPLGSDRRGDLGEVFGDESAEGALARHARQNPDGTVLPIIVRENGQGMHTEPNAVRAAWTPSGEFGRGEGMAPPHPCTLRFGEQWGAFVEALAADWQEVTARATRRRALDDAEELLARTWQALDAELGDDPALFSDLQRGLEGEHADAALAAGVLAWLGEQNIAAAQPSLSRALFEKALTLEPDHPMALLNLVEALGRLGEGDKAVALARRGLALMARDAAWSRLALSAPHYPPLRDEFRGEWEAAAWRHAGDMAAERTAKKALVRGRLHSILAMVTKDLAHFHEATLAQPGSASARLALGCALGRAGRPAEAAIHLEAAHRGNRFDPIAARTLHQAYLEIGAADEARELAAARQQLARTAPHAVALEPWFAADDRAAPGDEERPRVSLCMIVKNEEENLAACLRSAADLVDEMIIVDTGSTDATKDIAASFGAKVFDFPWVDSFSAARNESLRHARGRWVFWLDADDRVDEENRSKLRQLIETLGNENHAVVMKCRCLAQAEAAGPTVVDHIRLFRNHPDLRWEHRIHEQILPSLRRHGATVLWTDIVITHTGYVEPATVRRKQERDLRLLLLEREELNDHPFTLFNLGSTYLELGLPKTALPVLKRSLERSAPSDSITRKLYVLVSQTFRKVGRPAEALDVCTAGRKHFPHNAELLFQESSVREDLGDLPGARHCLESALETPEEQHFASVSEGLSGPQIRHRLGQLYAKEGDHREAERHLELGIAASPQWAPLWVELGQLLLKAQRWGDLETLLERMEERLGPTMEGRVLEARGRMAQGAFSEAIQALETAIKQHPKAVWPRVILSHALLQQGTDFAAAERALKAVLALEPGNQEARRNLSVLQERHMKK